jgi:acyl-CoA thioester hydrolase
VPDPAGLAIRPGSPRFAEIFFVVREFSIRFLQPIMGVGPVQIHFWIDRLSTSSVDYCFRVKSFDGAVVHAEGRRAQTKVDQETLRPSPVSSAVREACAPLLSLGASERIAS